MRSRLLMSAAILVVGLAAASAQTLPGGSGRERDQARNQLRNHDRTGGLRNIGPHQAYGFYSAESPRRNPHGGVARRTESQPGQTAFPRARGQSGQLPPVKHNDASLQAPRGRERGSRMAGDRSVLDRAMGQGRLRSDHDHNAQNRGPAKPRRHQLSSPLSDEQLGLRDPKRGNLVQAKTQHRQLNQGMRASDNHEPGEALAVGQALSQAHGQAGGRHHQVSRQVRGQDHGQARNGNHGQARNSQARNSQVRKPAHAQITNHQVHSSGAGNHTRDQAGNGAPQADLQRSGGDEIRKVQAALNQHGFNVGNPDGKLGRRTKRALVEFQKQRGLHTTGKADRETVQALLADGAAAPVSGSDTGTIRPGSTPIPNPGQPEPSQAAPSPIAPGSPAEPRVVPAQPGTTGQGAIQGTSEDNAPATTLSPPVESTTPGDGLQMPDSGATGRVPAGSPQEEYKEETTPPGGSDQR